MEHVIVFLSEFVPPKGRLIHFLALLKLHLLNFWVVLVELLLFPGLVGCLSPINIWFYSRKLRISLLVVSIHLSKCQFLVFRRVLSVCGCNLRTLWITDSYLVI